MTRSSQILEDKLLSKVGKAIEDYSLIEEGDNILVALSGGKDSWTLLHLLELLRKRAPIKFSLKVATVHPGFEGFETDLLEAYLRSRGFEYIIKRTRMLEVIREKLNPDSSFCSFCARLRRGILYNLAPELGCNKIALAHNCDDTIETLLLNQFYSGQLKAMPPKLFSDVGRNIVIRPMIYLKEADIAKYADAKKFPIIYCKCPVYNDQNMKRKQIKKLLAELEIKNPGTKSNILTALSNVVPSHLMDTDLRRK